MTKELPLFTDEQIRGKEFANTCEYIVQEIFEMCDKAEKKGLKVREKRLGKIINELVRTETEGFYYQDGKRVKVCQRQCCSRTRQAQADALLEIYNEDIMWKLRPHWKGNTWITTQRDGPKWTLATHTEGVDKPKKKVVVI